jgi:hypothetical protein
MKPIKFYVVICNAESRLFQGTLAGPLAYIRRQDAACAARLAKSIYGWAKVVRCEVHDV